MRPKQPFIEKLLVAFAEKSVKPWSLKLTKANSRHGEGEAVHPLDFPVFNLKHRSAATAPKRVLPVGKVAFMVLRVNDRAEQS